jgi:ribonuclease III
MAGESRRQRLRALAGRLGAYVDLKKLETAFVHESAVREKLAERSNERLEFLGDAILGMVVARDLFERYPNASEGELTLRKAALVNDETLATSAERLGLEPLLLLGAGLANAPSARRRSTLANAFEALVAVIYREAGLEAVSRFIEREHVAELERIAQSIEDPKTILQEWTQKRYTVVPTYTERAEGPAHERTFFSQVAVLDEILAAGSGPTKKAAQRAAAESALELLRERYGDIAAREFSAPVRIKRPRSRGSRGRART